MKRFSIPSLLLLLLLAEGRAGAADSVIPEAWTAERYTTMMQQSPFALATATPVASAPQASFAANWFVGGIGRMGNVDYVSIKSRDLSSQFSLFGKEPNADGVTLAEVQWSEVLGKSTVILKKGNETARLEFNEADLRGPAPTKQAEAKKTAAAGNSSNPGGLAKGFAPEQQGKGVPPLPASAPSEFAVQNVRRRMRPIGAPQ